MVAIQKGMIDIQGEYWSEAVVMKLNHVGVKSVKDFIASATSINRMLAAAGHQQLLHTTLMMMFKVIAKLLFGPNVGPGAGREPSHEV